ncbi:MULTISPECIES: HNH endonuclease family protein [Amycolatopsis]|uniref:HNH endonuclease family protein n=1 Tax=Amycolatopsis tucumanensis TaxID=401106 RepID=A0ABP7HS31_9PSEU|nr:MULTISPECIES: HNH endonuclease family protein [Amycolatopsis]MCF6421877.1 HNH endonuclease family protein [Amycolatopsis tucumanensis]
MRIARNSLIVLGLSALLTTGIATGTAVAEPPNIPSETTARSELAALTVQADGTSTGYSRDKFPHWDDQGGSCNTREVVLKRDGTNVVTDSSCAATSGTWKSPYDGATWTAASDVDIDHVVPLAAAWRTGASAWTTAKREAFANDLTNPQLIAVTDNVNQAKGDKSPDEWKPPLTGYWCTYAKMWIDVKYEWQLTIDSAEKAALTEMLDRC